MAQDRNGNNHKAAGRPDGGQFDRKAGQGSDDDLNLNDGDGKKEDLDDFLRSALPNDEDGIRGFERLAEKYAAHPGGDDAGIAALWMRMAYEDEGYFVHKSMTDDFHSAIDKAGGIGFDAPKAALSHILLKGFSRISLSPVEWCEYDAHPDKVRLKGPAHRSDGLNEFEGWWTEMARECRRLGVKPRELARGRIATEMDGIVTADDLKTAGFKATRTGGESGWDFASYENRLDPFGTMVFSEHDGYRLERGGKALTLTYGRGDEDWDAPRWTISSDECFACLDGDGPSLDEIARNFDRLAANDIATFDSMDAYGSCDMK